MDNSFLKDLFLIFQVVNCFIVYNERHMILEEWKTIGLRKKIGRVFMFCLPLLVMISLTIRPL